MVINKQYIILDDVYSNEQKSNFHHAMSRIGYTPDNFYIYFRLHTSTIFYILCCEFKINEEMLKVNNDVEKTLSCFDTFKNLTTSKKTLKIFT